MENMLKRNLIIDNNTKKRLIHPNLMVWEDTRKTIGDDGILEIKTKPPNLSQDIKWRVFYTIGVPQKVLSGLKITLVRVLYSNGNFYT